MLTMLLTLGILLSTAFFGTAALVYDVASRVSADCGGHYAGYTPADWSPPRWASGFDPELYFTSDYRSVRFPSRDAGIELHGWWLPADDPGAPAVVVIHGRSACVRHPEVLAPAAMLRQHGFSVLLLDLRDHGASTVEDGRYAGGTEEYRDVIGAVDWLLDQGVPAERIGLLGTSLGAATAIIAGGEDDRVRAVWADTSFADIERRVREDLEQRGLPTIVVPAATLIAQLVSGDDVANHTVLGELAELDGRHLFITHGALDDVTFVSHAYELLDAARASDVLVDAWIVPDAGHVQAMFLHPQEYQQRLGRFFEATLG
ncbi:MAG: alpha/beta fold hydrolase [Chloroflexota bacterium]|jgi:dipeptidyl aminopeptidase/acylaminoacyl peptidase